MTPDPKYFAKLRKHGRGLVSTVTRNMLNKTHSNTPFGTFMNDDLFASTGNNPPNIEPTRITKIEATRKPKNVSAPPPDPQFRLLSASRVTVTVGRATTVEDMVRSLGSRDHPGVSKEKPQGGKISARLYLNVVVLER